MNDIFLVFYIATFRVSVVISQQMFTQKKRRMDQGGQAAVEYLLTLTVIFVAFGGVTVIFSDQVSRYLSLLFKMIQLPF